MIRKGGMVLVCVTLLVVIVLICRELLGRTPAQSQRLPDGNVLTLTDAKVGSKV